VSEMERNAIDLNDHVLSNVAERKGVASKRGAGPGGPARTRASVLRGLRWRGWRNGGKP
jgi:hypothetical protein